MIASCDLATPVGIRYRAVLLLLAPLEAISSLLRHSNLDTTTIYARVDVRMLRELVQPWPFAGDVR